MLSGLLTEVSWRLTLLLPAPVAAVVLVAATRLIPRGARPDRRGRRFDLPGAATVTAAMLLLVYAVVGAPQAGWASARTLGSFAAVAVLLAAFVVLERRSPDPLVRLGIFRSAALTRANLAAMVLFGSYVAFQFLVTQYLQIMAGWSALATALAFLPAGVLVAAASTRMGPALDRFGPPRIIAVAFVCLAAGYAWFLRIGPAPDYPAVILPSVLLIGAAFGLGFSSLNIQATAGVADQEQGLASGILQTSFQRRGRGQPRDHVPGAARLPSRARGDHGDLRARRGDRARRPVRPAEAARRRRDSAGRPLGERPRGERHCGRTRAG